MEDFNALASSLALGVGDVRGCLILSRDGLMLGSHPAQAEKHVTSAWLRFATLGEPERAFAQFGHETWCYLRRGPYAAFAVLGPGGRPGLAIDQMDQVLLAAEEARSHRESLKVTEHPMGTAVSKPRSQLHPDHRSVNEPLVIPSEPLTVAAASSASESAVEVPQDHRSGADATPPLDTETGSQIEAQPSPDAEVDPDAEPDAEPVATPEGDEGENADPEEVLEALGDLANEGIWGTPEDEEVDRFSLAREFGQLLQRDDDGADG